MDSLMTVKELAEYLKCDENTIYQKVDKGLLPCVRLDGNGRGAIRFVKAEIDAHIKNQVKGD